MGCTERPGADVSVSRTHPARSVEAPRRGVRAALAVVVISAGATGLGGMAGSASAQTDACASYSALGAADGMRTAQSAPGFSPTDADVQGPAAQAQVDAISGSNGFAGAPYSEAAAGNAGAGGVDATQVPVFVISSHPARPEDDKSTPAYTLVAKSEQLTTSAEASGGPPASEEASFGRASTAATASCAEDGTVSAVADTVNEVVNIAGVLSLGSVRSHAEAVVGANGEVTVESSMTVEGATVLGQGVQITDEGVVTGDAPTALPANPLDEALAEAGVTVRYLAAEEDAEEGQALAPGLEIVVSDSGGGVPGGASTTYTFGRSFARASATAEGAFPLPDAAVVPDDFSGGDSGGGGASIPDSLGAGDLGAPTDVGGDVAAPSTGADTPSVGPDPAASADVVLVSGQIANVSVENVYPALVVGALVLGAAWFAFENLGVRLRWR